MGTKEIVWNSIDEFGVGNEIVTFEFCLAARLELQGGDAAVPLDLMDHSDHVPHMVGSVGYTAMPEADVADDDAALGGGDADRWFGDAALGAQRSA